MSIPDYQSLMRPLLALAVTAEDLRVRDAVDLLAEHLHLTPEERAELLPSGTQTVLSNRVHWAKTYLAKAGLLTITGRGRFAITARGREVLAANPDRVDNMQLVQFEEFRQFRNRRPAAETEAEPGADPDTSVTASVQVVATPDEIMRDAHRQVDAALAADLLERIRIASPTFFERLIVSLLLAMGYGGSQAAAGRAIGRSGDDGIDGVIDQDALGLDRVYIQAKRYAEGNNVGPGAIRDFFGSLDRHKASKGLFVTTSGFSASARETAEFLSKRIVLIDGDRLAALMIRHSVGCRVEETLHIRKLDEDFFE